MNLVLLAAAGASAVAPQWHLEREFPPPEEVLASVERCGVTGAQAGFDDLTQTDLVTFPADIVLEDGQVTCLAEVAYHSGYEIALPVEYRPLFHRQFNETAGPWYRERAEQRIAQLDTQGELPVRIDGESAEAFARRLESFCMAEGALSSDFGPHILSPEWAEQNAQDFERTGEVLICLFTAGSASDFTIGFIGNESLPTESQEHSEH